MTTSSTTKSASVGPENIDDVESKQPASPEARKGRDRPPWSVLAAFLVTSIVVLVLLAWSVSSARLLFTELLVAAGAISLGGLLGFLFGMPRGALDALTVEEGGAADPSARYRPSNNLEQVSDWLTKILIGVGLVELRQLGGTLNALGRAVESSLNAAPQGTNVVTQVIVVAFLVLGFLASFLWTRIYYGPLQTLADSDVVSSLRSRLGESQRKLLEEEKNKKNAEDVARGFATGEIAIPTVPPVMAKSQGHSEEPSDLSNWPDEIRQRLKEFRESPSEWNSDPGATFFPNAQEEANGRRLEADLSLDLSDVLVINLRVQKLQGEALKGTVAFLLHPTFDESVVYAQGDGDKAEVKISCAGWFTVVAILDAGQTVLSYDLKNLPNAPDWFTKG